MKHCLERVRTQHEKYDMLDKKEQRKLKVYVKIHNGLQRLLIVIMDEIFFEDQAVIVNRFEQNIGAALKTFQNFV